MKMTGTWLPSCLSSPRTPGPSRPGIVTSTTAQSAGEVRDASTNASPDVKHRVLYPPDSTRSARAAQTATSSSTTHTRSEAEALADSIRVAIRGGQFQRTPGPAVDPPVPSEPPALSFGQLGKRWLARERVGKVPTAAAPA